MQAGVLQQILTNDGRQVLVVSNVLSKDHEGNGHIGNRNGGNVRTVDLLHALQGGQEGKFGDGEDLHTLKHAEVDDGDAANGEDGGNHIAGQNADDEGDQLGHLLAVGGGQNDHKQRYQSADEGCPDRSAHNEGAVGVLRAVGEHVLNGSTCQRQTDQGNCGSDDHRGHQLVDPVNAGNLDDDGNDHIYQTGQSCTDDQTGKASGSGDRTGEGCHHGADKGEGGAQEHGASKLGEELIDDGTYTGAQQSGGSGHAVANDGGNCDGSCQDCQDLLECEHQHLAKLGLVFDAIDQIHVVSSKYSFVKWQSQKKRTCYCFLQNTFSFPGFYFF